MSFNYSQINPAVIDDLKRYCEKPTTAWSDEEALKVAMIIEAIKIAISQRKGAV